MTDTSHITDHAVLRYLERAHGLDVEYFRAHIAGLCAAGVREGASAVAVENIKFVLVEGRVVSCVKRPQFVFPEHLRRGA
jgi:hypothetical protein